MEITCQVYGVALSIAWVCPPPIVFGGSLQPGHATSAPVGRKWHEPRAITPARHAHRPPQPDTAQRDHTSTRSNSDSQRDYHQGPAFGNRVVVNLFNLFAQELHRVDVLRLKRLPDLMLLGRIGLAMRGEILQFRWQLTGAKLFQDGVRGKGAERLQVGGNGLFHARFDDEMEMRWHDDLGVQCPALMVSMPGQRIEYEGGKFGTGE